MSHNHLTDKELEALICFIRSAQELSEPLLSCLTKLESDFSRRKSFLESVVNRLTPESVRNALLRYL